MILLLLSINALASIAELWPNASIVSGFTIIGLKVLSSASLLFVICPVLSIPKIKPFLMYCEYELSFIVLKDGEIVEQGKQEDLFERRHFYTELYNSQFDKRQLITSSCTWLVNKIHKRHKILKKPQSARDCGNKNHSFKPPIVIPEIINRDMKA